MVAVGLKPGYPKCVKLHNESVQLGQSALNQAQEPVHAPKPLDIEDDKENSYLANMPVLENYLNIDGKERVLLEECVELRGTDFPQLRGNDAQLHCNLIMAFAACGYKCPVKPCG